jgi:hypothetical protein
MSDKVLARHSWTDASNDTLEIGVQVDATTVRACLTFLSREFPWIGENAWTRSSIGFTTAEAG